MKLFINALVLVLLLLCGSAQGGMIADMIMNSGPRLVWQALTYDPTTYEMELQSTGTGTPTLTRTTTQYVLDNAGVYQAISANQPAWYGARYSGGVAYADDGAGNLLSPLPLLQVDPALTNSLTYSRDLTNAAWTATNMTTAYTSAGLTGAANTATRLTATADNATIIRAAATSAASGTHASKLYLKRITGTGTISITLDNGSTWTDVTSSVGATWSEVIDDQAALTDPQVGIKLGTNTDAIDVGNAGLFLTKTISQVRGAGPIFTTTAAVTTGAQWLAYDIGNHSNNNGAYYMVLQPLVSKTEQDVIGTQRINSYAPYLSATGGALSLHDGANLLTSALEYSANDAIKLGFAYRSASQDFNTNGTWVGSATYDGAYDFVAPSLSSILYTTKATYRIGDLRRYHGGTYNQLKAKIDELMP